MTGRLVARSPSRRRWHVRWIGLLTEGALMSYSHYDRLTALDASFLDLEDLNSHMHVGSVGLFDAAPLRGPHGGLDHARIWAVTEAGIARHARFRQKLTAVPLFGNPVWVDDAHFNLHYHLRHAALPAPGDIRQLKRLTGRIMSQQLDRGKPLWEMLFVEGVEGDRFAVITKLHHCMVDGISGADLLATVMRPDQDATVVPAAGWIPRTPPSPGRLLVDEAMRRMSVPLLAARAAGAALREPRRSIRGAIEAVEAVGEALAAGLRPASPTPINVAIGPHRRFDWTRFQLDEVKAIRRHLGGTLNDIVLAIVSGAMGRFLHARGERVSDLTFRAMVPVSVRGVAERGALGNKVSFLMTELPIAERDPRRRLERVIEIMRRLKSSHQVRGTEVLEEVSDMTFASLFAQLARLGARSLSYNMVVTNVPGPQFPVYLLGAPLQEVYPLVPLFNSQGLGIALFSYDGGLFWGFNADWDAVPDLHDVVGAVETEFKLLREAAAVAPVPLTAVAERRPPTRRPAGQRKARRSIARR
jgi:WS/DGAT/MGAT family acyltransferase